MRYDIAIDLNNNDVSFLNSQAIKTFFNGFALKPGKIKKINEWYKRDESCLGKVEYFDGINKICVYEGVFNSIFEGFHDKIAFSIKECPKNNFAPYLFAYFNTFEDDGLYLIGFSSTPGNFNNPEPVGYIHFYDAESLEFLRSQGYEDTILTPDSFRQFGILPDKEISMEFDEKEYSLANSTRINPFYTLVNRILTNPEEFTNRLKDQQTL